MTTPPEQPHQPRCPPQDRQRRRLSGDPAANLARRNRQIRATANEHGGLITRAQLSALGNDKHAIAQRVANGFMTEVHPGVYFVGAALTWDLRCRAANLAAPGAALSGETAVALYGLGRWPCDVVELTTGRRHVPMRGVELRVASWLGPFDACEVDHKRLVTPPWALHGLSRTRDAYQVAFAMYQAERTGRVTLERLDQVLARCGRSAGTATFRTAVDLRRIDCRGTRSDEEDVVRCVLVELGWADLAVNTPIDLGDGGEAMERDFRRPANGWNLEVDGSQHRTAVQRAADRKGDRRMHAAGHQVERITTADVRRRGRRAVVEAVARFRP